MSEFLGNQPLDEKIAGFQKRVQEGFLDEHASLDTTDMILMGIQIFTENLFLSLGLLPLEAAIMGYNTAQEASAGEQIRRLASRTTRRELQISESSSEEQLSRYREKMQEHTQESLAKLQMLDQYAKNLYTLSATTESKKYGGERKDYLDWYSSLSASSILFGRTLTLGEIPLSEGQLQNIVQEIKVRRNKLPSSALDHLSNSEEVARYKSFATKFPPSLGWDGNL